jgi:protein-S-isoprenylcysteine O-methyltransferase Ste14
VERPQILTAECHGAETRAASREPRRRDLIQRVVTGFVPAAILAWLGVEEAVDAIRGGVLMMANSSWPIAVEVVREILYGAFLVAAAVVLWTGRNPRFRDRRARVIVASLSASFLLVGVGHLPMGPVVWEGSVRSIQIGLLITVVGAALAVAALASLGSNFSIVPEAQALVVTGPYRSIRHPMYLAELLMMFGIAWSDLRITYLIGSAGVACLQVYRIRAEERLLGAAFPTAYKEFVTRTRYRIIPGVW